MEPPRKDDKYRIQHPELPWDLPEFNPSAYNQRNIAEFKGLFEREVYDENYGSKTREEKEELISLVKGFRFYYMEDIVRFMLKIFDNKISHVTLIDQLAYRAWL
uniref:Mediator of RNA polymerase II transcription subunit 7 n=1 Tax=Globodera pallida TaxID=36090 RepID=A0A183C5T2_GLOPA